MDTVSATCRPTSLTRRPGLAAGGVVAHIIVARPDVRSSLLAVPVGAGEIGARS